VVNQLKILAFTLNNHQLDADADFYERRVGKEVLFVNDIQRLGDGDVVTKRLMVYQRRDLFPGGLVSGMDPGQKVEGIADLGTGNGVARCLEIRARRASLGGSARGSRGLGVRGHGEREFRLPICLRRGYRQWHEAA
jgi:hypothetical protein